MNRGFDGAAFLKERGINPDTEQVEHRLVSQVLFASSFAEAFDLYTRFLPVLAPWRFVLASESGDSPGEAINKTFSENARIIGLFGKSRVRFIDYASARDQFKHGIAHIPFDYSIGLDTQAMSYLIPYILGTKSTDAIPKDMGEVVTFLASENINVDPLPYVIENLASIRDPAHASAIRETLEAYEHLRSIDRGLFQRTGKIRTFRSASAFDAEVSALFLKFVRDSENDAIVHRFTFRHQLMVCILLKIVVIQFDSPKRSLKNKLIELLRFMHEELGAFFERETVVASRYFVLGQTFPFFSTIQIKRNARSVFDDIENMAWDLWHLRHLEEFATTRPDQRARHFVPALLTFDRRFGDLLETASLRGHATRQDSNTPYLRFSGQRFGPNTGSFEDELTERFFNEDMRSIRQKNMRRLTYPGANVLIEKLRAELMPYLS
jgi:hypothetical protein